MTIKHTVTIKRKGGFSLLEILVVLAVLGILLGISGFLLSGYLRQVRLNEATRTFGETLRRVSEIAATESQYMVLKIDITSLRWREQGAPVTELRGSLDIPNVEAIIMPTGGDEIEFTGRGLPQEGYLYQLVLGDRERSVYLAPTGAVIYP